MSCVATFPPEERNPREAAEAWMDENPEVVAMFERFALELVRRGRPFGIALVRERVRWECAFAYSGEFKICNTHSPYIARRLIARHPQLADLIETRSTRY